MDVAKSLSPTSDDLWAAAVGTLGDELRSQIDFNQNTKQNALGELLAATEEARTSLVDRSWSFKRKNGEKVIVRDVLAKVAKWISHFKEIGDIVVQYDPVHAALPWAGVRLLLNIALGDLDTYNTLLESTTDIAEYICRNALVESLLKGSLSPATDQGSSTPTADELSRALVKLYAAILGYLAMARSYYNQNNLKRVLKHGVFASFDLESAFTAISKAQNDVDRCCINLNLQVQLKMHDDLKRMLKHFDAPVKRWDEALNVITDHLDAENRGKILRWISAEPYKQHHEQMKSDVLEGTGKWLLQDPTFLRWRNESASSILWLRGIPGSGKSKLTSIVIEHAQDAFKRNQTPAPVYFYCSRNPARPGRSDPSTIVASIARQLSTPQTGGPLLEAAVEAYKQRQADAFASGPLRLVESKDLILKLLDRYKDAAMTIVIDALDECDEAARVSLLDMLEDLLKASPCLLKIFVSSRNDQDIVYKLDNYPNLDLSSERNSADIDLFVQSETERLINKGSLLRFSRRKKELQNKIIHELTSNADGMFRWVSLQLQAFQQYRTDEAILERLGRLPRTLAELYQEVLARIENFEAATDRTLARNALSWMLCNREQLRSHDFLAAVSTTKDESTSPISKDQLLHLCCNLIHFDSTLDVFHFCHLSVREFLEAQETYKATRVNAIVAEACLFHMVGVMPKIASPAPLLEYSSFYWPEHAQAAGEERQARLGDILRTFLSGEEDQSSSFNRWSSSIEKIVFNRVDGSERKTRTKLEASMAYVPSALLVICAFNLYSVLSPEQWKHLAQKRPQNQSGATHEEVAVRYSGPEILEWHFRNGIPFQIRRKTVQAAAMNEDNGEKVMALLLDKQGAEVQITKQAVKAAARNRNERVMALLLEKRGTEIQITEDVVKAAAGNGSDKVMALLLDQCGSEIQITESIIKAAAENGSGKVMALLLDKRGAEIQITEDVVQAAAGNYNSGGEVLALLLDQRGADIHFTENLIKVAAMNSDSGGKVMTLLLDKRGAEIQITESILMMIAENFDETIFGNLLHKRGAEIQITEDVVIAAAENFFYSGEVMPLLLDKRGAEIQITQDIVIAAARNENFSDKLMTLLLDKYGAEIQITEDVLLAAAWNCNSGEEVMTLLLDQRGAEIRITEDVVIAAAENIGGRVMPLLLDKRGAEIQITKNIVKAVARNWYSGEEAMILLLNKRGAEIQITGDIVKAIAENSGERAMALLLDKYGAKIQITEDSIKAAAGNKFNGEKVMSLLLHKRGAEIKITEDVIKAAAENLFSGRKIMALLLDKCGAEIQITENVVKAAAGKRSEEVMALLLDERGAEIQITEDVIKAAVGNDSERVMALLLDKRGTEIQITEDVIKAAAGNENNGKEVMILLLDECRAEIQITEDIIKAAAGNENNGEEVMALLLDEYGAEIQITENIIKAAARNRSTKVIALLLDKRGAEIQITEDIIKAAARDGSDEVIALLLNKCGAEIQITEDVAKAAAGNWKNGKEVMGLLLDRRGSEIQITEDVVKTAAETPKCVDIIAFLLRKRNRETIAAITDNVCFNAAACGRLDALWYLCQHIPPAAIDPCWYYIARFYNAAEHGDLGQVKQLLQEPIPIDTKNNLGESPLWIAAFNRRTEVVKILTREKKVNVNSLSASGRSPIFWPSAYGYEDVVNVLVSAGAKSHYVDTDGQTAVSMAKQNGHERIVRILLDAQSKQSCQSMSVRQKAWWKQLFISAILIFLIFIFDTGMLY